MLISADVPEILSSPTMPNEPLRRLRHVEWEQFQRDGFLVLRQLMPAEFREQMLAVTLDGVQHEIAPVEYEADLRYPGAPALLTTEGGRTIRRLKQAHSRHHVFTQWLCDRELTDRLVDLLGPRIVMPLAHHNCIMTKQPKFSSDTGWHQDIRYWAYLQPDLVSVWISLVPERIENGCLRVIPGSHRMNFDRSQFDEQLFFRTDLPENSKLIATSVPVELDPGDVLFFHAKTLHAASRNHSMQTKYSVVFTFRGAENLPVAGSRSAELPELLLPA
ncbi:MAG: phytanoyl-CoA dioxygenase family protein [Planctomycetia bacterium]|nr:phytanoyl-CoA dioxygenase family protein [Planctomycetia bacterium]